MQPKIPGEAEEEQPAIEEAIERVRNGDKQAYRRIIVRFERQMYTYCYYILKNHAETEDAVQDIFIRAYKQLHLYNSQGSFSAWLYKLAYHHLMNVKKKQGRWLKLMERVKTQESRRPVTSGESAIQGWMECLTTEERHILLLRAVEQYTFDEIAKIMDVKPATARKKYERLRQKLMEHSGRERKSEYGKVVRTHELR